MSGPALADDFWLAAHDKPGTGGCYLKPHPLGVGIGAALLVELLIPRRMWMTNPYSHRQEWADMPLLSVQNGQVAPHRHAFEAWENPEAVDDAAYEVLCLVAEETRAAAAHGGSGASLLDLLHYFALKDEEPARALLEGRTRGSKYAPPRTVGSRTVHMGRLTRQTPPLAKLVRRGFRFVHVPANSAEAGRPAFRIKSTVERGGRLDPHDLVLAHLFRVTALDRFVYINLGLGDKLRLEQQLEPGGLPADLEEVFRAAEQVLGDRVMR